MLRKKIVLRCINGWFKKRKELLFVMFYDIFVNALTTTGLLICWICIKKLTNYFNFLFIYNKLILLHELVMFTLIFWFLMSTSFILIKHIKFIMQAVNIMGKRLDEEI